MGQGFGFSGLGGFRLRGYVTAEGQGQLPKVQFCFDLLFYCVCFYRFFAVVLNEERFMV